MHRTRPTARQLGLITGASLIGVGLAGCVAPGWDGQATVVELEVIEPSHDNGQLEGDALEVTVMTDRGTESSVEVDINRNCFDTIDIGKRYTVGDITVACGELSHSTDD